MSKKQFNIDKICKAICKIEIFGHKNAVITLQRYTHSMLSYKTEMMNKMGKMLNVI